MNIFSKKFVGIDFHDYYAQLVELKLAGDKVSLEAYNRVLISPSVIVNGEIQQEEELKKILQNLLLQANPRSVSSKEIGIIFPSTKVFHHIFSFPKSLKDEEMKQLISADAEKIIPYAITEVYWDYSILEETKENKYVLFGAIIKETADKYIKLFESIGLKPTMFGIEAESLKYATVKELAGEKDALVIDLNTLSTNYLIIKDSTIKHYFSSNEGGRSLVHKISNELEIPENEILEDKEKNIFKKSYIQTINKFIEKHYKLGKKIIQEQEKNDPSIKIETIILAGEFLNLPNLYKIIEEYFPDKQIHLVNPGNFLTVNATKFLILDVDAIPYSTYFTHSLGIALRGLIGKTDEGINLLPDTMRAKIRSRKIAIILACISIIMSAIALFVAGLILFKQMEISYTRRILEKEKASIENLLYGTRYQDIRDAINQFNKEVLELSLIDNSLFSVPVVLQEIQDVLPKETIKVTGIHFADSESSIELTGVSKTREDLLTVVENLKKIEFVDQVSAPISNYGEKYEASFILKVKLNYKKLPKYGI